MKPQIEVEVHEAVINKSIVVVDFTSYQKEAQTDAEAFPIAKSKLIAFVLYQELNLFYTDVLMGDFVELDVDTYLADNLDYVVKSYLEVNLVEAA